MLYKLCLLKEDNTNILDTNLVDDIPSEVSNTGMLIIVAMDEVTSIMAQFTESPAKWFEAKKSSDGRVEN